MKNFKAHISKNFVSSDYRFISKLGSYNTASSLASSAHDRALLYPYLDLN